MEFREADYRVRRNCAPIVYVSFIPGGNKTLRIIELAAMIAVFTGA